jgi:hypothetical protein
MFGLHRMNTLKGEEKKEYFKKGKLIKKNRD